MVLNLGLELGLRPWQGLWLVVILGVASGLELKLEPPGSGCSPGLRLDLGWR